MSTPSIPGIPGGIRGKATLGARWEHFRDLNNAAVTLLHQGRFAEATAQLEAAYRETLVADVDAAGLDARARVMSNLAGVSEGLGRIEESIQRAGEALGACEAVLSDVGDRYGTRAVMSGVLINRAQTFNQSGRLPQALADLDAALKLIGDNTSDDDRALEVNLHNTKTVTLMTAGRWEEAESEASRTLELSLEHLPELVGYAYGNLASIKQATADPDACLEFLHLSAEAHQALSNDASQAMATANLGRMAIRRGDVAGAEAMFTDAEDTFTRIGQPVRVAETRCSRGLLAMHNGDPTTAIQLLTDAAHTLKSAGSIESLAECHGHLGDVLAATGQFLQAEASYRRARHLYVGMGNHPLAARLDGLRAVARYLEASTLSVQQREATMREAMDLALPAALATDAIRHRFRPGPARERWVNTVAVPAMSFVFTLAVQLNDSALLWELMENAGATVSLQPVTVVNPIQARMNDALNTLTNDAITVAPSTTESDSETLPFSASAFLPDTDHSGMVRTARFALPPRLRITPDRASVLADWIDLAEQRYGFDVRSREEINSWLTDTSLMSTSITCWTGSTGPSNPPFKSKSSTPVTCTCRGGGNTRWASCAALSSHEPSSPTR